MEHDKYKPEDSEEQGRTDANCDTKAQDQKCDKIGAKVDEI